MGIERILVIDDEVLLRNFLQETLKRKNYDVHIAESGESGLSKFKENNFDLVITDMKMPDMTGIDVLKTIKTLSPQTVVIVITAYGSVENAVEAMRLGAFNYLIKPFTPDTIEAMIEKAKEHLHLVMENAFLREEVRGKSTLSSAPVFESPLMKKIIDDVIRVAKSNANIFITGESGTGKEVIAALIHQHSLRINAPFIKVNCAAIPKELIESELFGHERGAFTGAVARKIGKFELAHKGTLFLDEISELYPELQVKLLRVLEERRIMRVGGSDLFEVDFRLIAATNRDLEREIESGKFREDLYYRLNVFPVWVPPLRERIGDVPELARHLEAPTTSRQMRKAMGANGRARTAEEFRWPDKLELVRREMRNAVRSSRLSGAPQPVAGLPVRVGDGVDCDQVVTDEFVVK